MGMSTTQTIHVVGMTCDHCVRAVQGELELLPGVRAVDVDLPSGLVTIESDTLLDQDAVGAAVDEAGYELAP
jgi:copper chaperone CopZ